MNIYVTGVEKSCGKTVISAGIAAVMQSLGYRTGVYKPIQTNAIDKGSYLISPDLAFVKMLDPHITTHSSYMLKSNAIPSFSCKEENIDIELKKIIKDYTILENKTDTLLVEATGGLMNPLNDRLFSYQIPQEFKIPILYVLNPANDTISNYLNEINTAKVLGLDVAGIIINKFQVYSENPEIKSFPSVIEKYSDAKVIGLIRNFKGNSVQSNVLINEILNGIDFEDVFRMKIPKLN